MVGKKEVEATLSSGEAGCHSGGPLSVSSPIAKGDALIMPTPLLFKYGSKSSRAVSLTL